MRQLVLVFTTATVALQGGCIIPVPLSPSPGSNHRPVIVKALLSPPITQPLTHSRTDRFEFKIVAEDDDIEDDLYALLRRPVPNQTELIGVIKLRMPSAGVIDQPTQRAVVFESNRYCDTLPIVDTGFVSVLVSDRDFADPIGDAVTAGLTDEAAWVLTCQ